MPDRSHRVVVRGDLQSDSFVLFYLDGDKVRSAMGPNAARDLRFARRLIESRKSVDPELLADTRVAMSKV
jgi:3-phenylpropionate/trans-cinnamate dioxygenase ferredoxin reductase component